MESLRRCCSARSGRRNSTVFLSPRVSQQPRREGKHGPEVRLLGCQVGGTIGGEMKRSARVLAWQQPGRHAPSRDTKAISGRAGGREKFCEHPTCSVGGFWFHFLLLLGIKMAISWYLPVLDGCAAEMGVVICTAALERWSDTPSTSLGLQHPLGQARQRQALWLRARTVGHPHCGGRTSPAVPGVRTRARAASCMPTGSFSGSRLGRSWVVDVKRGAGMAWAWHRLQAMRHARQKRRGSSGLGTMMGTLPFQCTYRIETGGDRTRWFWDGSPPRDRSACDPMLGAAELRVYLARLPACSPFCVLQEYHVWRGCFGAFLGLGSGQMEVDVARSLPCLKLPDCLPALGSIALWSCLCSGGRQFPACRREAHPSPAAEHFLPTIDRIRLGTHLPLPACHPLRPACLPAGKPREPHPTATVTPAIQ